MTTMISITQIAHFEPGSLEKNTIEAQYLRKLFTKEELYLNLVENYTDNETQMNMSEKVYKAIFKDFDIKLKFKPYTDEENREPCYTIVGKYIEFKKFYDLGTTFTRDFKHETLEDFKQDELYYVWEK